MPFQLFVMLACIYCFPPPYSPVDPAATADYTATEYDYSTDDRTPTVELPGKQSHSPLPHIAYLSIFICCTRHLLLLRNPIFNCIAFHCRPLFTFRYPMQPKLYYTAVNPALC